MPYEPTQERNPHQLTTQQHIISRAHIAEFSREDMVEVTTKEHDDTKRRPPTSEVFCADRVWSEKVESQIMKRIEDAFIDAARRVEPGEEIGDETADAFTEYWALWLFRANVGFEEHDDLELHGIGGKTGVLTKDDEEILEKNGANFIREDGTMPSRFGFYISMMRHLDQVRQVAATRNWCWRVFGTEVELVLGDSPFALERGIHAPLIPLGPRRIALTNVVLAFCGDTGPSLDIGEQRFPNWVNRAFKKAARCWYLRRPPEGK